MERQIAEIVEKSDDEQAVTEAKNAQKTIMNLSNDLQHLQDLKQYLQDAKKFLEESVPDFNQAIDSARELLESLKMQQSISTFDYPDSDRIAKLLKEVEEKIKAKLTKIDDKQAELDMSKDQVAKHANLLDNKSEEETKLRKNEAQIEELDQLTTMLNKKIEERAEIYRNMLASIVSLQSRYTKIIEHFTDRLTGSSDNDCHQRCIARPRVLCPDSV